MEFIKAKTILSKVKYGNEWYGVDYNMNLYRGCSLDVSIAIVGVTVIT